MSGTRITTAPNAAGRSATRIRRTLSIYAHLFDALKHAESTRAQLEAWFALMVEQIMEQGTGGSGRQDPERHRRELLIAATTRSARPSLDRVGCGPGT